MRHHRFLLSVSLLLTTLSPAFAGGMGDSSANTREKNAICEAQKRGEGPLYPNLCMPEYPPDAVPAAMPNSRY